MNIKGTNGVTELKQLIVLLPTRNEEEGLGEVIDRIPRGDIGERGFSLRVVVIDGYSTDETCKIAIERGAELIRQDGGKGKGIGVRQAIESIFSEEGGSSEDCLVMLDADATYSPEDITRFIDRLVDYEVVWGSRLRGKIESMAMSRTNKLGNQLLSLAASLVFLRKTTDLCTGYWGFQMPALRKLPLSAEGFNLEADLFGSVSKLKMKTKEIVIDYAHREGESNLKWYKDGPRIFFMIIKKRIFR